VEVYSGPSKRGHQQLHQLKAGTPVYIEGVEKGWYRVRIDRKARGWVPASHLIYY